MLTVAAAPFEGGATVLIRALVPFHGIETMLARYNARPEKVTDGPGNLSKALGITVGHNTLSVLEPDVEIEILPGVIIPPQDIKAVRRPGDGSNAPALRFFFDAGRLPQARQRS